MAGVGRAAALRERDHDGPRRKMGMLKFQEADDLRLSQAGSGETTWEPGGLRQAQCSAVSICKGMTLGTSRRLGSTCRVSGVVRGILNVLLHLFFLTPFELSFVTLTLGMRKCKVKWLAQHYVADK